MRFPEKEKYARRLMQYDELMQMQVINEETYLNTITEIKKKYDLSELREFAKTMIWWHKYPR